MTTHNKQFIKVGRLVVSFSKLLERWERPNYDWEGDQVALARIPNVNLHQKLKNQLLEIDEADSNDSYVSQRNELRDRLNTIKKPLEVVSWLASFKQRNSDSRLSA